MGSMWSSCNLAFTAVTDIFLLNFFSSCLKASVACLAKSVSLKERINKKSVVLLILEIEEDMNWGELVPYLLLGGNSILHNYALINNRIPYK